MLQNRKITTADKLKAIARELALRRNVYPKRIAAGVMKRTEATYELEVFEAIADDYRDKMDEEQR